MRSAQGAGSGALLSSSKRFEGSSDLVHLRYHMGPVLSSPINLYLIWYGPWPAAHRATLRDFLLSLSDPSPPPPSAAQWWSTVALYSDQTGANVSRRVSVAAEAHLRGLPRGASLTRLGVQLVIADALASGSLPVDHGRGAASSSPPRGRRPGLLPRRLWLPLLHLPFLVGHTLPTPGSATAACSAPTCAPAPSPCPPT
ncbi:hypothetical protein MUK42_07143 [Musa troglodytarum]|nr:hypothetical protein MUK42_07143 [Musa troglodytarum]